MITLSQIKAARALLDWKQEDLARKSSLSLASINNLERGLYSPRKETLDAIKRAFVDNGVEFLKCNGVAIRETAYRVTTLTGPNFIAELDQDILSVLMGPEDELLAISHNEKKWIEYSGVSNHVYLKARQERNWGERIIVANTIRFLTSPVESYRLLPPAVIPPMTLEIYGDRYAMIEWEDMRVTIIQNELIANSHRIMFNGLWAEAQMLTKSQLQKVELYSRDQDC